MSRTSAILLSIALALSTAGKVATASETVDERKARISETARLYLESSTGYVAGDLLTESQFQELQHYLRSATGVSPATHRALLHRTIKDTAPLSRFFYRERGNEVLRAASIQLGGYALIEALSLRPEGRDSINQAIAERSEDAILAAIEASRGSKETTQTKSGEKASSPRQRQTIYTLEEYLEAAFSSPSLAEKSKPESSAR